MEITNWSVFALNKRSWPSSQRNFFFELWWAGNALYTWRHL